MSPLPPKPRRTGLIIALSLLGVILTGAIVWLLLSGPKDDQNIKKEAQRRDSLRDAHNGDSIPGEAWDSDAAMKDFMDKYGGLLNATSDNDDTPRTFWQKPNPKPKPNLTDEEKTKAEEAKKAEEARKAEAAKKAEEEKANAEEARKAEAAKKADEEKRLQKAIYRLTEEVHSKNKNLKVKTKNPENNEKLKNDQINLQNFQQK